MGAAEAAYAEDAAREAFLMHVSQVVEVPELAETKAAHPEDATRPSSVSAEAVIDKEDKEVGVQRASTDEGDCSEEGTSGESEGKQETDPRLETEKEEQQERAAKAEKEEKE